MGANSLITQSQLQSDLENFYETKVYPYLNGSAKLGFTPIGTVISVMSNEAPDNYLVCDGTTYNISEYSDLANFFEDQFGSKNYFGGNGTTTFAVPDLRGEFLRGSGANSHTNQGNGSNVGIHQDGTEHPQIGTWKESSNIQLTIDRRFSPSGNGYTSIQLKEDSIPTTRNGVHVYNTSQTIDITDTTPAAFTSRPTNTSVLYCIAYKNIYFQQMHNYSTTEHVVGTWIDGKPLYEKTFEFTGPNELQTIVHYNDLAVGENTSVKDYTGIYRGSLTGSSMMRNNAVECLGYFWLGGTDNHILCIIQREADKQADAICTVRYTKTTDTV